VRHVNVEGFGCAVGLSSMVFPPASVHRACIRCNPISAAPLQMLSFPFAFDASFLSSTSVPPSPQFNTSSNTPTAGLNCLSVRDAHSLAHPSSDPNLNTFAPFESLWPATFTRVTGLTNPTTPRPRSACPQPRHDCTGPHSAAVGRPDLQASRKLASSAASLQAYLPPLLPTST